MLDSLRTNLRTAIKKIVSSSGVDKELIAALALDVQRALLYADVDARLVTGISSRIKERAASESPPPGLPRKDHIVKIVYEEMARLLGEGSDEFKFQPGRTNRVLMLGIQGSGKTTVTSKLAKLLTKQGYRTGVVGADTYRPGALVQLRTMCERAGVEVYGEDGERDPAAVVRRGLKKLGGLDVVLIDTAGRHKEDAGLLEEMREIGAAAEPDLALLVIDGTIGRRCFSQAEAFHKAVAVGGIAVTKLDSSAKGGGALAASSATGARVMYIGTGERIDDIEQFSPTRFVGRLLGMGDIQAVLDLAKRLESESDDVRLRRMANGKMNMDDFYCQLEQVGDAGALRGILDSMPGVVGSINEDQLDKIGGKMVRWRHIIQSMTQAEKADPDLINASRTTRIARGSGRPEHDVKELLKGYRNSKGMMKAAKGRNMKGTLRKLGIG